MELKAEDGYRSGSDGGLKAEDGYRSSSDGVKSRGWIQEWF